MYCTFVLIKINWLMLFRRVYDAQPMSRRTKVEIVHALYFRALDDYLREESNIARWVGRGGGGWVVWCGVGCGGVRCRAVLCGAVRCGAVRCGAVRCGAVRCGAVGRKWGSIQTSIPSQTGLQSDTVTPVNVSKEGLFIKSIKNASII